MSQETAQEPVAAQSRPGLRQRLSALVGRLAGNGMQVAQWSGIGLTLAGAVAIGIMIFTHKPRPAPLATLDEALDALDRGADAAARRLAERLEQQHDATMDEWGGPSFVLGAVAARQADAALERDKTEAFRKAAEYLEEAEKRGFPEGREADGRYLLAKCLYRAGRLCASRAAIKSAIEANPEKETELRGLLASAYLQGSPPELAKALAENQRNLAAKDLPEEAREEALVQRAKTLIRLGRFAECAAVLDKLPSNTNVRGEVLVLRGRLLRREAQTLKDKGPAIAAAVREKYQEAINAFRKAQGHDSNNYRVTSQAMYLIGLCQAELGDQQAALAQFTRTGRQFPESPDGLAAEFQAAELARRMKRDSEAVAAYRHVLAACTDPAEFHNPWFSLKELQDSVLVARRDYLGAKNFEPATQLSRLLAKLLPHGRAMELEADAHRSWGQYLLNDAEHLPTARAEVVRRQGRAEFRRAADLYARVARLEFTTRQYPDRLWQAVTAFMEGQDYRSGARLLEQYLRYEFRKRHPQALVELGAARLALGEWDKAVEAFRDCITYHPRDAAAYRARLLASRAWMEKGDAKQAEALLQDNLSGGTLAPASKEWRDSLFALGELLHAQGRYVDALRRLDEAVVRYPDVPQSLLARYLAADACRRNAQSLRQDLDKEPLASVRQSREAESRGLLQKALAGYQAVQEALARRDERDLSAQERAMLRNARFAPGEIHCELGEYEQAVRAYTAAANRYPNTPEALDAYVQLSGVYRRMQKPAEARASLEQAKIALAHMTNDARFTDTTNFDRKQWGDALELQIANCKL
jgi:tetratricopeptide (TPR) repeat protein